MRRCLFIVVGVALVRLSGLQVGSAAAVCAAWNVSANPQTTAGDRKKPAEPRSEPRVVELDSTLVFTPLDGRDLLTHRLQQNTARPLSSYLAVSAERFYGVERYELSKTQCALFGADTGMTLGLMAGALGMTVGLWDERTAWSIAGAAAALGAVRGMSVADEPAFRIRLRWDDSSRGPDRR